MNLVCFIGADFWPNMLALLLKALPVVFGGLCTLAGGTVVSWRDNANRRRHAAAVLYYDLKSIENYLNAEEDTVNIRFFNEWQSTVTECAFLPENYVELLYKIYDLVYDYNYYYTAKEKQGPVKKADIVQFKSLKDIMLNSSKDDKGNQECSAEYKTLMEKLEKTKNKDNKSGS